MLRAINMDNLPGLKVENRREKGEKHERR